MTGMMNEKIVHKETDPMEDESVESLEHMGVTMKCLTFVPVAEESMTQYHGIRPARD
jgi:hypothetical protein